MQPVALAPMKKMRSEAEDGYVYELFWFQA